MVTIWSRGSVTLNMGAKPVGVVRRDADLFVRISSDFPISGRIANLPLSPDYARKHQTIADLPIRVLPKAAPEFECRLNAPCPLLTK